MARRVSLQVWLFAILGFTAFGTVYTIVYLQHLETISEERGFHHYRRARDFGRRRDRSSSSFSGGRVSRPPPPFADSGDLKSSNAADWLHDRNARNAEAAAGTGKRSIGGGSGSGVGPLKSAEHVKLDVGGFYKRQRQHAKARRADSRGGARSGHGGNAGGSIGSMGRGPNHAMQQTGGAHTHSAEQHVSGGSSGASGTSSDGGGSQTNRDGAQNSGSVAGNDGSGSSSSSGASSGERHAGYDAHDSGGGSSRGRPQGRRGDPARCGRGVPRGQENRFCCEGLFVCGGSSSSGRDNGDATSAAAAAAAAASKLQKAAPGPKKAAMEAAAGSGNAVIDCARVNDNFADCPDGSDEPGTSAASHLGVRFTCHDGVTISTSFVDDGICDCCDGSDERPPRERCRNTCAAKVDEDLAYI